MKFLIDTGANKNYISPQCVHPNSLKIGNPSKIKNINGSFKLTHYVETNPFFNYCNLPEQKYYLFKFHDFFDGLIGFESLRTLGAVIDTAKNTLTINNVTIALKRKYPNYLQVNLCANETINKPLPVPINEGDFFLGRDIFMTPDIFIPTGIYTARKNTATFPIVNLKNEPTVLSLDTEVPITEIYNFQEIHTFPEVDAPNTPISDEIRTSHLNKEESSKLLGVIREYEDVFYREGSNLSFSNIIKHNIDTKDDIPIHSKSYRYPFVHKQEVQRQIADMLAKGIIRPSTSPWCSPIWIVPKKN